MQTLVFFFKFQIWEKVDFRTWFVLNAKTRSLSRDSIHALHSRSKLIFYIVKLGWLGLFLSLRAIFIGKSAFEGQSCLKTRPEWQLWEKYTEKSLLLGISKWLKKLKSFFFILVKKFSLKFDISNQSLITKKFQILVLN